MTKKVFGSMPDGTIIYEYKMINENIELTVLNLGGIIRTFTVDGTDIIAGFDSVPDYLEDDSHQGALIGRTCNRIRGGRFVLNGKVYTLAQNVPGANLHGGIRGFDRHVWTVESASDTQIVLSTVSPDGEEGYPGTLRVQVTYTLCGSALKISYYGICDADTAVCMTNHAYFNLLGYGNGDILGHVLRINSDEYSELDSELVTTGRRINVEGTPYDFRTPHTIGALINDGFGGYDINYVLNTEDKKPICGENLPLVATMSAGGLEMNVYTTEPCMQLYIGNMLQGKPDMKGGRPKQKHCTVSLETQIEPDSYNRGSGFLRKGEVYGSTTVYEVTKK